MRYSEYTGFIPASNPIDWAKLTSGLVSTIQGIGAEREAEKAALDKLAEDNAKIIQNTELGKTQTFDELILNGSNQARDKIFEWNRKLKNGEIKPVQYKNLINNLKTSWSTFANTAKSYDQQMAEALKRQEANEKGFVPGSELEITLNQRIAELGNLRNKTTGIDDNNGNFIIGELNNDGLLDPSSIMDLRSVGKPGNVIDNRIDLDAIVDNGTKGWELWTIESGNKTTTDASPAIEKAKLDLAGGILNNPRAISGVLTGYTEDNYDYYFNQKDLDSKLQDRISKENELNKQLGKPALSGDALNSFIESERNKFIFLAQDDQGVYQPNLTNDQVKKAQETVLNRIDSRIGKKVELDEPQYRGGGDGGSGGSKVVKPVSDIATRVYNAVISSRNNTKEAERELSKASGGKYVFKYESDGLNVYKVGDIGELVKQNSTPFKGSEYANDLWPYFPVNDTEWISDLERLRQKGGARVKKYTSAQEANIKATLKANPGATREEVIKALGY
jgi:hypothetical protein